jgi:alanine racemase
MTRQSLHSEEHAWIEVDLSALRRNATELARRAEIRLIPMIKADAYGLGAVPVAKSLESLEPWGYGVATVAEGRELREAGIGRTIIVCSPLLPSQLGAARDQRLTPTLGYPGAISLWEELGGGDWHLSIDTGMSRAGIPWRDVSQVLDIVRRFPPQGAMTHFHSADLDLASVELQEQRFREALGILPIRPGVLHVEASAAMLRRGRSEWDLARPGIAIYGGGTGEGTRWSPEPVVSMRARVVELRDLSEGDTVSYGATYRAAGDRRIATLPVGYADGYRRSLSRRGSGLIAGTRAPVAGAVTMDMTMLDVTGATCSIGDVATLLGSEGNESITIDELGLAAELSPYEILTGLSLRLTRRYSD